MKPARSGQTISEDEPHDRGLGRKLATSQGVEALVLAGSVTSGLTDEGSDYDLHAYTREAVPLEFRARLLKPRAARLELHNTFLRMADIDIMIFSRTSPKLALALM